MGQIGHPKMSVAKYLTLPRNIPQQRKPQLHHSRSLKSCSLVCCYSTVVLLAKNAVIFFLSQWGIKNSWKSIIMRFVVTWKTVVANNHCSGLDWRLAEEIWHPEWSVVFYGCAIRLNNTGFCTGLTGFCAWMMLMICYCYSSEKVLHLFHNSENFCVAQCRHNSELT